MLPESNLSKTHLDVDGEEVSSEDEHFGDDALVVACGGNEEVPTFGNIAVTNSSDVQFGNRTVIQGPVTIKQFLYANGKSVKNDTDSEIVLDPEAVASDGVDNPAFITDLMKVNTTNKPIAQDTNSRTVKGFGRLKKFSQENTLFLVSLLIIFVVSLVILMMVMLFKHTLIPTEEENSSRPYRDDEQNNNVPVNAPLDPESNLTLPSKLKLVSRLEWLAQPPVEPANPLVTPVPYVIILHTATENCSSQAQCVFQVRFIQTFHIESRNWWDIGYNFLVGGDGEAYEGRGWKSEGAHTYGFNSQSIGIAFIGTFNSFRPPERQIVACKRLIEKGVELGYIRKDYKLLAHRQLQTTQSPGQKLYDDMKTWPHWATAP